MQRKTGPVQGYFIQYQRQRPQRQRYDPAEQPVNCRQSPQNCRELLTEKAAAIRDFVAQKPSDGGEFPEHRRCVSSSDVPTRFDLFERAVLCRSNRAIIEVRCGQQKTTAWSQAVGDVHHQFSIVQYVLDIFEAKGDVETPFVLLETVKFSNIADLERRAHIAEPSPLICDSLVSGPQHDNHALPRRLKMRLFHTQCRSRSLRWP
jgi:hypothetical protein